MGNEFRLSQYLTRGMLLYGGSNMRAKGERPQAPMEDSRPEDSD